MKTHAYRILNTVLTSLLVCGAAVVLKAGSPGDTLNECPVEIRYVFCPCEGPTREFVKTINRDFKTSETGTTAIYNRHGDVNIRTWSENRVKINITVIINAYDQNQADQAMNQINANFTNTNGYIKAETMIGNLDGWSGNYAGWLDKGEKKCQDYRINYEVWIPAGNQLDLQNKYGACFVSSINGRLLADVRHGDLRVENARGEANIKMLDGKATFGAAKNLYGQIASGGIVVENATDVQMDTWNSDCTFRRATNVRLTSKYDNLALGNIDNLRLQAKYSDVSVLSAKTAFITSQYADTKISNVSLQLDADFQNADLTVNRLNTGFDLVNLIGNTANISITRAPGVSYRYAINGNNTSVNLATTTVAPKGTSRLASNVSGNGFVKEGLVGNDSNTRSTLKARMTHGSIVLK